MAGPWEQYAAQPADDGPWSKYAQPAEPVNAEPVSRTERVIRGMKDPLDGAAQLFEQLMPKGFNDANRSVNNWIADKTGMLEKMPESGVDGLIKQQEQDYQGRRTASGESGFDGYRTIGNVASPVNLVLASKLPAAASFAGRIGVGALGGGASAALNPVMDGDFWRGKGEQVATGAAFGGVVPAITGGIARVISPNASNNANVALLKSEGVKPTIGQTLGGWANTMEEKAQSLPIVGDAITAARQRANEQMNKAAFNRALAPIGEKLPSSQQLGGSAVEYTNARLSQAYDKLLPKLTTQADTQFNAGVQSLKSMVNQGALDPKYSNLFDKTLKDRVLDKFQGQNSMTGQTLKDTESFLTGEIKRFGMSQDPDARLLGDAYKQLQSELRGLVTRSNPQHADELKAINTGWANFKRVQNAAAKIGSDEGVFTPAQLQNAVRALDKSKDKARFSEGNALMQDLSGAAKSQIGGKVADSGTAGRLMLGGGALGAALVNPMIPIGLLTGAAAYTPAVQGLLRGAVSNRGSLAEPAANALRKAAPMLIPGGTQVGLGLLN